jgi:hypothetical protein
LNLKCDILVSKAFAFHKCKLYRYNKQHLKPDELSDLLDDANERWGAAG